MHKPCNQCKNHATDAKTMQTNAKTMQPMQKPCNQCKNLATNAQTMQPMQNHYPTPQRGKAGHRDHGAGGRGGLPAHNHILCIYVNMGMYMPSRGAICKELEDPGLPLTLSTIVPRNPRNPETPENRQKPLFLVIYGRMGPWDPSKPVRVAISFNLPHRFVQMDEYGAGNDLGSFNLSVLSCLGKYGLISLLPVPGQ